MSGSSSVVSLLPRGAVPYCSTWCSLCCLAAQPRRLQLLVTGSASSPLRRPSPPVFVSWRRLSMVSNALLFFYICSFLLFARRLHFVCGCAAATSSPPYSSRLRVPVARPARTVSSKSPAPRVKFPTTRPNSRGSGVLPSATPRLGFTLARCRRRPFAE